MRPMPLLPNAVRVFAALFALFAVSPMAASAAGAAVDAPSARVIVTYRDDASTSDGGRASIASVEGGRAVVRRLQVRLDRMAQRRGLALKAHRAITERTQVVLARGVDSETLARRLGADPDVESAVVDRRVNALAVPSDPLHTLVAGQEGPAVGQWYQRTPNSTIRSAIDATRAWDITQGSAGVIVAVLDTGVRFEHPDLSGKLLLGYDFVSTMEEGNDGSGRDNDASDPGDWITSQEDNSVGGPFYHCSTPNGLGIYDGEDSSWHGTQVSGIVGALTNNGVGMAGTGWNTRVLPVRVLGKCGGFVSDVVVGMRWAAGLSVPGLAANANPAKVLNLSLGTVGACGEYQDTVNAVIAARAVVVAAAGNTNGHAVGAPANCTGVVAVGGLRHTGTKVGFSDLGAAVTISAPAGNCVNDFGDCRYPLLTTTNTGTQGGPAASGYTDGTNNITVGTSFSAPLVSGVAALMLAVQPTLTPAEITSLIQGGSRRFPTSSAPTCTAPRFDGNGDPIDQDECDCTTATCGAGMLDAFAAVRSAAAGLIADIVVNTPTPRAGQDVSLTADVFRLINGRNLSSLNWSLVDGGGIVSGGVAGCSTTCVVTPSGPGTFTVAVTVTDDNNPPTQSTVSRRVTVAAASSGGGGGGGGALGLGYLGALLAAVIAARHLQRRSRSVG